jgi:hypothetical protein
VFLIQNQVTKELVHRRRVPFLKAVVLILVVVNIGAVGRLPCCLNTLLQAGKESAAGLRELGRHRLASHMMEILLRLTEKIRDYVGTAGEGLLLQVCAHQGHVEGGREDVLLGAGGGGGGVQEGGGAQGGGVVQGCQLVEKGQAAGLMHGIFHLEKAA